MSTQTARDLAPFNSVKVNIEPTTLIDATTRFESEIWISTEPMQWLATAIENAISDAQYHESSVKAVKIGGVDETSIANMFIASAKVAIAARIFQVRGDRTKFDKKNFEYVSLLGPVLGMYGVYHDAVEAYDIIPKLNDSLLEDLKSLGAIAKDGELQIPEWYPEVMFLFRRYHLMTNFGLPKELTVDTNQCFKITVDGNCVIGKPGASVTEVLIASLVHSSKLTDLFGAYRTLYTGIATLRTTFELIGLKALHDLG